MPRDRGSGSFDAELMAFRLAGQQAIERAVDRFRTATAQQIAQLDLLVVTKASEDGARRGDADAVAAIAEIVGQRRDETQPHAQPFDCVIARRAAGPRKRGNQPELALE